MRIRINTQAENAEAHLISQSHAYMHTRMTSVPQKISELRERLGLKQGPFADLLGVSQSTVARWEDKAKPQVPQGDKLVAMAKLAGQTAEEFLDPDIPLPDFGKPGRIAPQRSLMSELNDIGAVDPSERQHLEAMIRKLGAIARGRLGRDE